MTKVVEFKDEYIKRKKDQFIEEFFKFDVKSYPGKKGKDGQLVDIKFEPTRAELRRSIFSKFNRFKWNMDWDEYISVVMLSVTTTVIEYEPKDKDFNWSDLNKIGSKSHLTLSKLVDSIMDSRLSDATRAIENKKPTSIRIQEDGKSVRYTALIDTTPDSTDSIVQQDDGETNLIQALGTNSKFGYQNSLYHPNHFLEYFNQNRNNPKNFLTNKQKEYIATQQKYLHEDGSNYTKPYTDDPSQPYKSRNRAQYRQSINERITKFYDEAFPEIHEVTLLQMKKEADQQLLNEFMETVYKQDIDDLKGLNTYINNWIYEQLNNANNSLVSDLLHDELDVAELKHMNLSLHNGYQINSKLIYKIVSLLEDEVQRLEGFDTTVAGRAKGNSGRDAEFHEDYRNYLHRINNKDINVYDLETGKKIGTEQVKKEGRNYKVLRLNTFGMRHEIGELDVGIN